MSNDYVNEQRELAAAWKQRTPTLPAPARQTAPWIDHAGEPRGRSAFCLPPEHADSNLLPGNHQAIDLFRELGIPWHCGIGDGPGNHLLSSQVQCVNALMPMVSDPGRVVQAFGHTIDIAEVLQIEPDRYLTFEYIGPTDYFDEGAGRPRVRGTRCTSVDAAFLFRTRSGRVELALVEWKFTEEYRTIRKPNPAYDKTRMKRYGSDYLDPSGPLRSELIDLELMLDEPFYQLTRQQLLAYRLEIDRAEGADVVRVLHVLPPDNLAYQQSLARPEHQAMGDTVDEVWEKLLRTPDRFAHVNPTVFLDPAVTSDEYVDRYSSDS